MKLIFNKIGTPIHLDGDGFPCTCCGEQSFLLYRFRDEMVCRECTTTIESKYSPASCCSECGCVPTTLYLLDDSKLICSKCKTVELPPEDIFDAVTKPMGGRLPLEKITKEELYYFQSAVNLLKDIQIQPIQPISKPYGLIYYLKEYYDKGK